MQKEKTVLLAHITHTDLDGFGCRQLATAILAESSSKFVPVIEEAIDYRPVHSDYDNIAEKVMSVVEMMGKYEHPAGVVVLVSDISFKDETPIAPLFNMIEEYKKKGIPVVLKFMDHHVTTEAVASKYPEYFILDTNRCGTKLVADHFVEEIVIPAYKMLGCTFANQYSETLCKKVKMFADVVDAYDRYQENSKLFVFGKFMNSFYSEQNISKYQYPDLYNRCCARMVEYLFDWIAPVLCNSADTENYDLDSYLEHESLIRSFVVHNFVKKELGADYRPTYHLNLVTQLLAKEFPFHDCMMEEVCVPAKFCTGGVAKTSKILYVIGFPSKLMMEIKDFHFNQNLYDTIVTIDTRGSVQFRSFKGTGNAVNVGMIAEKIGGGGHPCASGAPMKQIKNIPGFNVTNKEISEFVHKIILGVINEKS